MRTKTRRKPIRDSYFVLVKDFPLVPIRDDRHLAQASAILDGLLRRKLDEAESAYLDVLSDLVHRYEERHLPFPSVSQAAMLRFLMEEKEITQAQLARAVVIPPSVVSEVLSGARELSKANMHSLAKYFGVSPHVFLVQE